MAGQIQDRWFKTGTNAGGKTVRVKSDRHGSGLRYRARYIGPDGTEKSKSFPDGKKRLAEKWLSAIETDMTRGQYTDPKSVRITFRQYADKWLDSKASSPMARKEFGRRLRLHVYPVLGSRPIGTFRPEHIRELLAALEAKPGVGPSYTRNIFADVQSVLAAAVDDALLSRNPCGARTVRRPKPAPHPVFALPKGGKKRDVPLPDFLAEALRAHMDACKPVEITLPWDVPEGPKVSARLIFTAEQGGMVWRSNFNGKEWKPALADAGLIPPEADENGKYENIKAVSEYMGHADPGLTLRVCAHLMPESRERARRAIDSVFQRISQEAHGPQTAQ
ncbi:site-specific integrase [Streptomyces sp. NPDC057690]|uniref:site-specific integrase n=1 Tax=Streptomyces sp. NPDC057690 TaxID=3346214 RepID=UPI0036AE34D7